MPTGTNAIGSGTDNRLKNTRGSFVIAFVSFSILNQQLIAHFLFLILFFFLFIILIHYKTILLLFFSLSIFKIFIFSMIKHIYNFIFRNRIFFGGFRCKKKKFQIR